MDRYVHVETAREGNVDVIRFVDAQLFEHFLLSELQDELLDVLGGGSGLRVVIDFQVVEFCSTSLLNTLLKVQRDIVSHQGVLALSGMRESVREAFRMLNLDGTVFRIYDSTEDAVAAIGCA
jgi:anti-anti-sigma regulatory factor